MPVGTTEAVLFDSNIRVIDESRPISVPDLSIPLALTTTPGLTTLKNKYQTFSTTLGIPYDAASIERTFADGFKAGPDKVKTFAIFNVTRFDYALATKQSGVEANNNALNWKGAVFGPHGDNVVVNLIDPSAASQALAITTYQYLDTAGAAPPAGDLRWTSKKGTNEIVKVHLKDPSANSAALSVAVTTTTDVFGLLVHTITVNLATSGVGAVTSTSQEIIDAVVANVTANGLVTVAHQAGASDGLVVAGGVTPIKFTVDVSLATDAGSAITSTASAVKNAINVDTNATKALTVVNYATSDGTGVVAAAAGLVLDRNNTANSPIELTRALGQVFDQILQDDSLPVPYFLCSSTHDNTLATDHDEVVGDRKELSDAVASLRMYYLTSNNNTESTDTAAIHQLSADFASDRTLILAHTDADNEWAETVLAGNWGANAPGSFTTRYKTLNTIAPSKFTGTQINELRGQAPGAAGTFTYSNVYGAPVTTGSWSTDGSYADWRRDKDWLELHVELAFFRLEKSKRKVIGDARGIANVRAALTPVFDRAVQMGILAQDEEGNGLYQLNFPTVREWPVLDKARRILTMSDGIAHPGGAIEGLDFPIYATFDFFERTA